MASSEWNTPHSEGTAAGADWQSQRGGQHSRSVHTVKPGDTASGIASLYGIKPETLASLNGIRVGQAIYPGQRLELGI